jgi:hypothetical protein
LVAQSNKIELVCTTKVANFKIQITSNILFLKKEAEFFLNLFPDLAFHTGLLN